MIKFPPAEKLLKVGSARGDKGKLYHIRGTAEYVVTVRIIDFFSPSVSSESDLGNSMRGKCLSYLMTFFHKKT